MGRIAVLAVLVMATLSLSAQQEPVKRYDRYLVRGIVRDSVTDEGIPFASVTAAKGAGTLTDKNGIFELTVPDSARWLTASSQGYARKSKPIHRNRINMYEIRLAPKAETLGEVVITKQKYSKKNNPAVDLMQMIRRLRHANDPYRKPWYNYERYERVTLAINDYKAEDGNFIARHFPFLAEHVDTSETSGKPILPISVKESRSQVHHRLDPESTKELVTGLSSVGVDEITDKESMRRFITDILRETDLYDKDINLLQNRFVSPLSPLAADFYKFYITDSAVVDNEKVLALSFYPHNKQAFGFVGNMYVVPGDTAMFIKRVTMHVPREINLNFIQSLYIDQEFARAPDGTRLKMRDDLTMEVQVLPGTPGLYVRRNVALANHTFERPANADSIFGSMERQLVLKEAEDRDTVFWQRERLIPITRNEARVGTLMQRMRKVKLFYWGEKAIKVLAAGYVATGKNSKFDIGPLNTFVSYNTLEGLRLRAGGMTMANFSKHFFTRFYVAHGFRDHRWKYNVELEYSFPPKRSHANEFPRHSLMVKSQYDIDQLGQNYLFTSQDNIFLAWKRLDNDYITYRRYNALSYVLELPNNFSVEARLANERQESSRLTHFRLYSPNGADNWLDNFNESFGEIKLRYAPDEKFYQTRSYRLPINMDAPVVTLIHRYAPGGKSWSRWHVSRTELSVQKRFWFSAWGYLDIMASGGHVWSRNTPFSQLFTPNVNLSYTIQPESFALLNPMEFVTDSYGQLFLTYYANGAILNYIPLVKKLKLRECFSFSGYWGTLSDRNNPALNHSDSRGALAFPSPDTNRADLRRTPYLEASVGIENIFKCLRVDYVWRLTHRRPGYKIDHSGIRIALHFTF